jgi:TRAP-type transport system periplasmic protein
MTTRRLLSGALAAAIVAGGATAAAAEGPPDKSGGSSPVTLTLLNSDDSDLSGVPGLQRFIDRVRALSGGTVRIEVRPQNDGHTAFEHRVVRDVKANRAQLAWVGTRVWDTLGVKTFRALHAPMLVDSYPLEAAVLRSDLPQKMLAGLDGTGVVGLAILADNLRYPAGVTRPLREPADFAGIRFRSLTSATQAASLRALGARPSGEGWADLGDAFNSGRVKGLEIDLKTYEDNAYAAVAPFLTVNVALWPRTTVLIANANALAKLTDEQDRWVRQAAAEAAAYSLTTLGEDQRVIPLQCRNGMKAVVASPAQLARLRKAFAPVYSSLRRDASTAAMIDAIAALKKGVKAAPAAVPKGCLAPRLAGSSARAGFPEGVYRHRRTREDILRVWPNAPAASVRLLAATVTVAFADGRFDFVLSAGGVPGCRHGEGRYSVTGQYLTLKWTSDYGCPLTEVPSPPLRLRWSSDGKALSIRVDRPAFPLDLVTWESKPFVRIR